MMSDLIDRQAAIDAALTFIVEYCGAAFDEDMQKMLCERLGELPSAEPEQKKGKWIPDKSGIVYWNCSECGFASEAFGADILYHFCPNCGARMEIRNNE